MVPYASHIKKTSLQNNFGKYLVHKLNVVKKIISCQRFEIAIGKTNLLAAPIHFSIYKFRYLLHKVILILTFKIKCEVFIIYWLKLQHILVNSSRYLFKFVQRVVIIDNMSKVAPNTANQMLLLISF